MAAGCSSLVGSHNNALEDNKPELDARRAAVLEFTPDGKNERIVATGMRNPVTIAVRPSTRGVWATVQERDALGDDLPADFVTRVVDGGFYGWPWYYSGPGEQPTLTGQRPELKSRVIEPDVLLQPHSAAMQFCFYTGAKFPNEYRNDLLCRFGARPTKDAFRLQGRPHPFEERCSERRVQDPDRVRGQRHGRVRSPRRNRHRCGRRALRVGKRERQQSGAYPTWGVSRSQSAGRIQRVHTRALCQHLAERHLSWQREFRDRLLRHWRVSCRLAARFAHDRFSPAIVPCASQDRRGHSSPDSRSPAVIIINGYVWLENETTPGLGAHR